MLKYHLGTVLAAGAGFVLLFGSVQSTQGVSKGSA